MHDLIVALTQAGRAVADTELRDRPAHVVQLRRVLRAPVADVWAACTQPERVRRWLLPLSGDLRPGGSYQLEGNAGGTITVCEPPHRLALTWQAGPLEPSLVELALASAGEDTTELVLRHTVPDDDHWEQYGPGAVGVGWDGALTALTLLVAGETMPDDPQLMTDFMRASAELWGTAHRETAVSPQAAREAAARTRAFYAPEPESAPG